MGVSESRLLILMLTLQRKRIAFPINHGFSLSTMRSLAFKIFVLQLVCGSAMAQYRISGVLLSSSDSAAVRGCVVYLNSDKTSTTTDNNGRFGFDDVPNGKHTLHFSAVEFNYSKAEVTVADRNTYIRSVITPR